MDFAKQQYERIRKQLEGLTASQRMLTVMLLVVMGVTLVYWVKYAGKPEMEAILDQPMGAEDVTRIRMKVEGMGIPVQVTGDRVLVPADQRMRVFAALALDQALPANSSAGWDEIVKQMNVFGSDAQNKQWWLQAKQWKLAELIRSWPDVQDASVIIDDREHRGFGSSAVKQSATVNIKTRAGSRLSGKKLASSAADLVAGAQSGLERGRVRVLVNGASFKVQDASGADGLAGVAADEFMELRQLHESYLSEKIKEQLRWIQPEVIATVAVEINGKSTQEQATTYDPKGTAKVETKIKNKTGDESTESPPAGEPGVGSNTAGALADAGSGAGPKQSRNDNEEETEFQSGLSSRQTVTHEGAGRPTVLSASVWVPRSYFVRTYKDLYGGTSAKDPDESVLAPYLEKELAKIRTAVRGCVAVADEKAVVVETYLDPSPVEASPLTVTPVGVTTLMSGHGKEIALGALAVVSLLMMTMMVKKGAAPPVAVVSATEPEGPVPQLAAGEEIVGEATDGETVLGGMELDEDSAKAQQMLGQVSDLVKENPDAAANLIKRWLNK